MVHIANLTTEQALAAAEAMRLKGRIVLCHQILDQLDKRHDELAAKQKEAAAKRRAPRKRQAQTGELI